MRAFTHRRDDRRPYYEIAKEAGGVMLWRIVGTRTLFATEAEARAAADGGLVMPWWVYPDCAIFDEDAS